LCKAPLEVDEGEAMRLCRRSEVAQLDPATISRAPITRIDTRGPHYPWEAIENFEVARNNEGLVNKETMDRIRYAVRAVARGDLDWQRLRVCLHQKLSETEMQLAMVELTKDVNLHQTLMTLDAEYFQKCVTYEELAQCIIRRVSQGHDACATGARAVLSGAADTLQIAVLGVRSVTNMSFANFAVNATLALMLSSVELYRWAIDELSMNEMALNVGEHWAGCAAAVGGAAVGYGLGVYAGPMAPVACPVFAVAGSVLADFLSRKLYQWMTKKAVGHEVDVQKAEALKVAASHLGIDLEQDGFEEAKEKFRRQIRVDHPDKNTDPTSGNRVQSEKAADVIAHWQIVRAHYKDKSKKADIPLFGSDREDCAEVAVHIHTLKKRNNVSENWKVVRAWFGDLQEALAQETTFEKIEHFIIYM